MTSSRLPALVALLLVGCGPDSSRIAGELHGVPVPTAFARPDFSLTATDGRRYDFARETAGRLTLLFFGYTSCPDVCPATMASLAAAARKLTPSDRTRVAIVFVTTDPERDTPPVINRWLGELDHDFIGLTGSLEETRAAQGAARVSPAVRDPGSDTAYTVSHAAQVIVISPDDSVHIEYPYGTRQNEWADDLPKLLTMWKGRAR